jgi:AraC-like DNA-binding protein
VTDLADRSWPHTSIMEVDVGEPGSGDTPWHTHDDHELLWHISGTLRVEVEDRCWVISPGAGVWIPSGRRHRTVGSADAACGWALLDSDACPSFWDHLGPAPVSPLLRMLLVHLSGELSEVDRAHAETVVLDLLHPALVQPLLELPMPRDSRCRQIVDALSVDPTCPWELADWAIEVGASSRTLARIFQNETGMSFGRWRTHARVRAAIVDLAAGHPVGTVARRVGYASTSSFVTSFRRCTGRTPSTYFPPGSEGRELLSIAG